MSCFDCYHSCVCGSASMYNDVSMCKQFREKTKVLSGPAYDVVNEELGKLKTEVDQLERENNCMNRTIEEMERELTLLRIIKQTLEMSSGMTFDI